ncbi:hypothetical protein TELCIR_26329 [Teladorsagia circumcincta]|uniref:Uncharacterized protein n=1 Tax=Teladorsagia circumcincta TaxID=45464 RepID=A0A2G9T394_TELCI|nr:hypothetical protein TELCIR_26329 [Teladorsagia circumcincta]
MAQAKKELTAARLVRKNRKEYALLVGMIDDLPSRAETTKKLEDMQEELSQQQERQQQLEARLSERRNHLHALNIILANFQKLLAGRNESGVIKCYFRYHKFFVFFSISDWVCLPRGIVLREFDCYHFQFAFYSFFFTNLSFFVISKAG